MYLGPSRWPSARMWGAAVVLMAATVLLGALIGKAVLIPIAIAVVVIIAIAGPRRVEELGGEEFRNSRPKEPPRGEADE